MNELLADAARPRIAPARPRAPRWTPTIFAAVVGVLVVLAVVPATASAHAQLLTVSPTNGEVVSAPPAEVVLTFNEPVSLAGGDARVLDDAASQVSDAPVQAGVTVTIPLGGEIPDGTYTVTWEVVSTDSHRIVGASVFHVGAATSTGLDVASLTAGSEVAWGVRTGAVLLSGLAYACALVAVGAWCFTMFIERSDVDGNRPTTLNSLIVRSSVLGAVALVAAVPFRIGRIGGGLDALADNDLLAAELRGPIGQAVAVTALGLLAFAVLVERRAPAVLSAAVATVALAGFSLEGHTRAIHLRWAMIGSDVVHLWAGAVWLGGLVGLTLAFRSTPDASRLAVLVRRFSSAALVAVAVVSASGVLMAWIVLPTAGELTSTGYGLALVLKVSLVVVVVALGAFNRWLLVPVVSGRSESAGPARRTLSRIVLAEMLMLLVVVGVTSVLVTRSPIASTSAAGPPTTVAPDVIELELSENAGTVELSLSPGRVGPNVVGLVLRDVEGRIVNPIDAPVVEFTQPVVDIGPLRPDVTTLNIGRYELTADLAVAGDWEVVVRIRVSDFVSATASTVLTIE